MTDIGRPIRRHLDVPIEDPADLPDLNPDPPPVVVPAGEPDPIPV